MALKRFGMTQLLAATALLVGGGLVMIYSASAAVSLAMEAADIDLYLAVLDQALDELTA